MIIENGDFRTMAIKSLCFFAPDPPFFVKKPASKSAVAGDDVMIDCQASGDPHPDIVWTKEEGDIDISKAKIVHGKGLRIENVHPSDEGTYVCSAKNLVGKVTAKAVLTVLEKPVVSVQPPSSIQARAGERVQLDCLVTGTIFPTHYTKPSAVVKSLPTIIAFE